MDDNLIVGRNPVLEALKSNREIEKIQVAKGSETGSIKKIVAVARDKKIPIQYMERQILDNNSDSKSHQGVMAIISPYKYYELDDIIENADNKNEDLFVLILDGIEDPHNLGAILRTADAAGVHGVIIPKKRAVGLTATVAKASAGAIEYVPVAKVSNIVQTIDKLKKIGVWVIGSDMNGSTFTETDLTGKAALVIGSEGKGVSRLVLENCDLKVKIPMAGKISSLNASAAAAILSYEVNRQRNK